MNAYCVFHERTLGEKVSVKLFDNNAGVSLPIGDYDFTSTIDPCDKRTMVIFDGFLVVGCLPKNHRIIRQKVVKHLSVDRENFREPSDYVVRPTYIEYPETVDVVLRRYFILLPSGTAVVFRYRPKSLSPQAVIINVENGIARFSTSTY